MDGWVAKSQWQWQWQVVPRSLGCCCCCVRSGQVGAALHRGVSKSAAQDRGESEELAACVQDQRLKRVPDRIQWTSRVEVSGVPVSGGAVRIDLVVGVGARAGDWAWRRRRRRGW
jgi:hypothetical protein